MVNFEKLTGEFIVSALLLVSVFSFMLLTQSSNNAPDPIINNNIFNESMSSLINQIENGTENAEQQYDTFNSEEPRQGFASIVLLGIVSVGKAFSQIIMGFFNAIIKLPITVLGIPESVYSLVLTWLIIGAIVGAWLLYKLGS